ncbi:MAG: arginine--tRNA ligase [Bdellovibrio sp.]|nr:MAG: arginine--tRNA ligase [Bdellovibrio sp.]
MLTSLKQKVVSLLKDQVPLDRKTILSSLELPKVLEHGHLAMPMFPLAKIFKKSPQLIAQEMATQLRLPPEIEKVEAVAGYLNFHFQTFFIQKELLENITKPLPPPAQRKKIAIDFSSPNVAKPMHIGHLRATVIGQAIYNLAKAQGHEVIGINHLGDWGVQFGKLAWAYLQWKDDYDFENEPFESLYALYVRFHKEAEKHPEMNEAGSAMFKKLEEGDPEVQKIWKEFIYISMQEYEKLWKQLGVHHDLVRGESFYNDRLETVEKILEEKGLLVESEGALVVPLDEFNLPPCLIRKKDGASLYATRDIASAIYRMEELKCDLNLYVVGADQTLHFQQVFKVLEKMGYPWAKNCHHISFGMYRFKDVGKLSSRKGQIIRLDEVLEKAVQQIKTLIDEKNPSLPQKDKVAQQVGVGAIIFNDLVNDRVKDVEFNWNKALSFDGDSGPYVQYCLVRCRSILEKYQKPLPTAFSQELSSPEEKALLRHLLNYEETLQKAFENFKPHLVANYLLDTCKLFNHFYHKHKVLGASEEKDRLLLVFCTQKTLEKGLKILNMEAPQAM